MKELKLLTTAANALNTIQRVVDKDHEPNFANNSALIHAAVFGFIKE